MGSSYSNVIVIGSDQPQVEGACSRPAFVAADDGVVVVYAKGDDESDAPTEGALSARLKCMTLHVSVHDSDILYYQVFDRGELMTQGVVPDPVLVFGEEFADIAGESAPADPALMVSAIGRGNAEAAYNALTDDFVFAEERHTALLAALRLPTTSAGYGYRYLLLEDGGYQGPPIARLE